MSHSAKSLFFTLLIALVTSAITSFATEVDPLLIKMDAVLEGEPRQAIEHGHSLYSKEETLSDRERAILAVLMARAELLGGSLEKAEDYAHRAINLARNQNNVTFEARALTTLAHVESERGNLPASLRFHERIVDLYRPIADAAHPGEQRSLAAFLSNKAYVNHSLGHYFDALTDLFAAEKLAKETDAFFELAMTWSRIADVYTSLAYSDEGWDINELAQAVSYQIKAIELPVAERGDGYFSIPFMQTRLVNMYIYQHNFDAARDVLGKLELALPLATDTRHFYRLMAQAKLSRATGDIDMALHYARIALTFSQQHQGYSKISLANALQLQADLLFSLGEFSQALASAKEAKELALASKDKEGLVNTWKVLYAINQALGDYESALYSLEQFNQTHRALLTNVNKQKALRLRTEFNFELKEKELANLNLEVARSTWQRNFWIIFFLILTVVLATGFYFRIVYLRTRVLEQRVVERTADIELRNQTISSLLEEKDALLLRKNELFSNVSHEFKTPLTLILGPASKLLQEIKKSTHRKHLQGITNNAKRLTHMVDQLLDLARMDLQKQEELEIIEVNGLIRTMAISINPLIEEKKLQLSLDLVDRSFVRISQSNLEKIILNLLTNAIKFTPESGLIHIYTQENSGKLQLQIRDSGPGIRKEDRQRVFERFVRLDQSTQSYIPGAGVGLALVKEIIENANGYIEIVDHIYGGTCFEIRLPLASEKHASSSSSCFENMQVEIETLIKSNDFPSIITNQENHPSLLIVEDNSEMCEFLVECLAESFNCSVATNGLDGVALALNNQPDLILTDWMMPEKSGLELTRILREDEKTSHIPIIMLTAKSDVKSRMQAWQVHVDDFFQKPFNGTELLLRCKSLLELRKLLAQRLGEDLANQNTNKGYGAATQQLLNAMDARFLTRLQDCLETHFDNPRLNAIFLAQQLHMTEKQIQRKIKALLDQTIPEYVRQFRLRKGAILLRSGSSVTQAAMQCGFSSQNYFSKSFSEHYGVSPSSYQARNLKAE